MAEAAKWETVRRLRYGALAKLFRHRWGYILPDDDAGRGDLWELVTNVSLATGAPDRKIAHVIELWAPWMPADEAALMVDHVKQLTIFERTPTAKRLGERLRLTNAEREYLKLWPIKPIDVTDDQIAEQRRARHNERRRLQRGRTRADYLSACLSRQRPWEAEGITRRTWERLRAKSGVASPVTTIVTRAESTLATASVGEAQKGIHEGGSVLRLSDATKAKGGERTASCSPGLSPHLRQHQIEQNATIYAILAREFSDTNPRLAWTMMANFVGTFPAEREAA